MCVCSNKRRDLQNKYLIQCACVLLPIFSPIGCRCLCAVFFKFNNRNEIKCVFTQITTIKSNNKIFEFYFLFVSEKSRSLSDESVWIQKKVKVTTSKEFKSFACSKFAFKQNFHHCFMTVMQQIPTDSNSTSRCVVNWNVKIKWTNSKRWFIKTENLLVISKENFIC